MSFNEQFLITIGGILLLSLLTHTIGKRTFLPRVTLLMIFGVVIGKSGFELVPDVFEQHYELIADIALLMVGFLLGGKLTRDALKTSAKQILWISVVAALFTTFIVAVCLTLFGVPYELAIILGCIAAATDAAAIFDVVSEKNGDSKFSFILLSIVALDDAWAMIIFAVGVAFVTAINGHDALHTLTLASWEIGGALILGLALGVPAAYLTGRIKSGQPIIAEALGLVFVCGGLAHAMEVSFLIAAMVMGATIANLASHHDYPFHAIEDVEWPFMVVFFVLAGASLELSLATQLGALGAGYIVFRAMGKCVGAFVGGAAAQARPAVKKWMGVALLPQAGVAIGLALLASKNFPEYRQILLTVIVSSTVFFELIGPVFTRLAIDNGSKQEV